MRIIVKIVADEDIPLVREFFEPIGDLRTYSGRKITNALIKDADVLLVRTLTRINKTLLEGTGVKFVGTCTAGVDHIDQDYLDAHGIGFSSAPGCNADSVVDYVLSVLAALAVKYGFSLFDKCIGIVGTGNVGGRLKSRLEQLGVLCLCNDPPLSDGGAKGLVDLDELIDNADIVTLHTPLIKGGLHETEHLFSYDKLTQLRREAVLINTGRGEVIDNMALLRCLTEGRDMHAVLDVWEGEPCISRKLLDAVEIGTPHIAGYSRRGKIKGTAMAYEAVCRAFKLEPSLFLENFLPAQKQVYLNDSGQLCNEGLLYEAILACYDVREDDQALRNKTVFSSEATGKENGRGFDLLRKEYPARSELSGCRLRQPARSQQLEQWLSAVGISCPGGF